MTKYSEKCHIWQFLFTNVNCDNDDGVFGTRKKKKLALKNFHLFGLISAINQISEISIHLSVVKIRKSFYWRQLYSNVFSLGIKWNPPETFNQKVVVTDDEPFEQDQFRPILYRSCPCPAERYAYALTLLLFNKTKKSL